MPRKGNVYAAE
ncbi:hypothetical protein CGLO_18245 [Colletotrichum gloeosporioides Cg-14]|uniref:Uncharacterized protein n=1 Tax=Colletotrichum gloeosporioides (strain Cg-14) TaxID=1237896 RepID=T0JID6_COLGC|nr:hypothetical protein CGLO_18245 [Colletotrichum gloeosporioides Cg-14]